MKKKLFIEGMMCNNCARHVKEALTELDGITGVEVNLSEKYALIETSQEVGQEKLKEAIDEAGYELVRIE